ncbi:MAG: helix-turn-helix domain-containing protein [Firmicutes bacterium]|nr:helix-turn-helix domain-containing protein [Bacillota bacterium]MDY5676644.1 helix-turn-helix transcriptional regulator [Eubacteriales bacterium]
MEDYRQIIANNICNLRKSNNMTQFELAEKLHYSDKAISRWERGDTMPSVEVLCELCELFGVDMSYLVSKDPTPIKPKDATKVGNKVVISLLAISLIWLIATCIYVYSGISTNTSLWTIFIWAVPASALVADILNVIWGERKYSIITRTVFIWSLLTSFYVQFLPINIWLIFLLGIPMEACVILWCKLK